MDLGELREQYTGVGLDRADLAADPFEQFERWFTEVRDSGYWEPNAVVVSTVDPDGWPEGRNVLLKQVDPLVVRQTVAVIYRTITRRAVVRRAAFRQPIARRNIFRQTVI